MSKQLINSYYNQLYKIKQFSGNRNEGVISRAFASLLNADSNTTFRHSVNRVGIQTRQPLHARKENVIDLFQKACTVSVKTMEIVKEMQSVTSHTNE